MIQGGVAGEEAAGLHTESEEGFPRLVCSAAGLTW